MFSMKQCSEPSETYPQPEPKRWRTPRRKRWSRTQQVLKTVPQRARDHGVTFNEEKCQFGKEQIEFFANVYTKDGLKPSPDKVKAIKECSPPESKEAVRSFLGMAGYLDNYISNYAAIAAPLYQLTGKTQNLNGRKKKKEHSGIYKTPSQMTRQWHSLTHPDL